MIPLTPLFSELSSGCCDSKSCLLNWISLLFGDDEEMTEGRVSMMLDKKNRILQEFHKHSTRILQEFYNHFWQPSKFLIPCGFLVFKRDVTMMRFVK